MHKLQRRSRLLSQNFLHSRTLVTKLLDNSSLGKNDIVIEIGPGKGIITEQLLENSLITIGIEIDAQLSEYLRNKFANKPNLLLYSHDFLETPLPLSNYKVFANLPFAIEGKAIRKLLDCKNPPNDCYLIIRKDLAYRLSGKLGNNMFTMQYKPWFTFAVVYLFKRSDFVPKPKVDAALLRITKHNDPLLEVSKQQSYQQFIQRGFGNGLPIGKNLATYYAKSQINNVLSQLQIHQQTKPSELSPRQWVNLYQVLRR